MSTKAILVVNSGKPTSTYFSLDSAKPVTVKNGEGLRFILKNPKDNFAPDQVHGKTVGKDLHVYLDGEENPALIIEDYYSEQNPEPLQGMKWDGQLYEYIGEDSASSDLLPLSLGDRPLGAAWLYFVPEEATDLSALGWWLLGGGAALLAGGAALAAGGSGGSGGNGGQDSRQELPDISDVNVITDGENNVVTGKTEPDSKVVIKDKDGNIVGEGNSDKDGNFEITVPGNGGNLDGGSVVVTTPEGG
ncbi:TPA: hypothetical protein JAN03_24755, partial [Citrobacter freundii]|nr:hypothetical protein [Citrobacter freundii]